MKHRSNISIRETERPGRVIFGWHTGLVKTCSLRAHDPGSEMSAETHSDRLAVRSSAMATALTIASPDSGLLKVKRSSWPDVGHIRAEPFTKRSITRPK